MSRRQRILSGIAGAAIGFACLSAVPAAAEDVTIEQVIANPGDRQLSYTYARQQIRSGRLEQAAGALERLLLLEPNWDAARLLYAIVLYRLDDLQGAKRELDLLQTRPLSPQNADQVDRYLRLTEKKSQSVRVTGSVSIGIGIDSNPALASTSETDIFGDPMLEDEETDGSAIAAATLRIEKDLDTGRGDYLFLQAAGRITEQFEVDSADYARGRVGAGAALFFGDLTVTPELYYMAVGLDHEFLRHEAGGKLNLDYLVTPGFALLGRGGGAWLDFDETAGDPTGEERDGWRAWAGGGIRARFGDHNTFQTTATYHRRDADNDAYSYDALELHLSDRHLLGMGQYVLGEFTYWRVDYDEPIDFGYPEREDDRFKARLAYGVPLSTLFRAFGGDGDSSGLGTFNLQVSGSYYRQESNIPDFDSDNWAGELLLTKRFGP